MGRKPLARFWVVRPPSHAYIEGMSKRTTLQHPSAYREGHGAAEVLDAALRAREIGQRCALVTVTGTSGGTLRAPGALMAVTETGILAGYVSNGCVDRDVVFQAGETFQSGSVKRLRYGQGSPFFDIKLPCGGSIDLLITPDPDGDVLRSARDTLSARRPVRLCFGEDGLALASEASGEAGWQDEAYVAPYRPKPRLRIAGRGSETLAMTRLAIATGFDLSVQSPDEDCLAACLDAGAQTVTKLSVPQQTIPCDDDPWTAFVLMFHDHDWEPALLRMALSGDAFFIGAMGSRRTHEQRCAALAASGVSAQEIARIHAPIGLIPAMRDASTLAVSALADVVRAYHERHGA